MSRASQPTHWVRCGSGTGIENLQPAQSRPDWGIRDRRLHWRCDFYRGGYRPNRGQLAPCARVGGGDCGSLKEKKNLGRHVPAEVLVLMGTPRLAGQESPNETLPLDG
jgi:hypothetical protein